MNEIEKRFWNDWYEHCPWRQESGGCMVNNLEACMIDSCAPFFWLSAARFDRDLLESGEFFKD
jgi:hypothetical protein